MSYPDISRTQCLPLKQFCAHRVLERGSRGRGRLPPLNELNLEVVEHLRSVSISLGEGCGMSLHADMSWPDRSDARFIAKKMVR